MLDIDTPGGEGYAAMQMVQAIRQMNKPVISFINDFATSAGYMIASVSDQIFANSPLAITGSIGTYIQVADFRKQLEMEGITLHEIYAKDSVDKNRDYREAINYNHELVRERANRFNDEFLATVKTGREGRLNADQDEWGTGKTFYANEALEMGLIDGIMTFEAAVQNIFDNLFDNQQ
jgi:protease-4